MTNHYPNVKLMIANEWRDASGGATIPVTDPATGDRKSVV